MLSVVGKKLCCSGECIDFANVEQAEVGVAVEADGMGRTGMEVKVDDGEAFAPCRHLRQQRGGNEVDAGESEGCGIGDAAFDFVRLDVLPPYQLLSGIGIEVAGGGALTDQQRGIGCLRVAQIEFGYIKVVKDVDVMDEDGTGRFEQRHGFAHGSTGFEQHSAFVTDANINSEVVVGMKKVYDLLAEMVNVHDDAREACVLQPLDEVLQQRFSGYGYEGFGHGVGQRTQTGTQSGCKDEGGCVHASVRLGKC